jgi:AraC family transcriptional regulator
MDYRLEDKPPFTIACKGIRVNMNDCDSMRKIPAFWHDTPPSELPYAVQKHDGVIGKAILGVCKDFDRTTGEYTYCIAVEADPAADFGGFERVDVPAATYAVFESVGKLPEAIQAVWSWIADEFLPSGEFEHAPTPDIEFYPPGEHSDSYRCEVWIPVVKK